MTLSNKCKNCQHKTWACPGWMCGNEKHPMFDHDGDTPIMVAPNGSCELYEEGKNKIYVAIFNYFGGYNKLIERYPQAELVNGDTLCFVNIKSVDIAKQMEKDGCDYNYSHNSPEEAWRIEE